MPKVKRHDGKIVEYTREEMLECLPEEMVDFAIADEKRFNSLSKEEQEKEERQADKAIEHFMKAIKLITLNMEFK